MTRIMKRYGEQLDFLRKAIKDKVDAIGLCSKMDVGDVVVTANKMKIPIFVFNVSKLKMTPQGKVASYICYDQNEAGKKVGQFLAKLLRTKGNVAILEGIPNEIDSIDRKKGFIEVMKKYPSINIVASQPADWDRNKARLVTKKLLEKHPNIDAFFCLNDEMALGTVDAVKEAGKIDRIFTIGLDGNQNALQSIKAWRFICYFKHQPSWDGKSHDENSFKKYYQGRSYFPQNRISHNDSRFSECRPIFINRIHYTSNLPFIKICVQFLFCILK